MSRENRMIARAKEKVLASTEWLTLDQIVQMSGISEHQLFNQLQQWKADKRVFSIHHDERELFPSYAFDRANQWQPYESVSLVLESFGVSKSQWAIAIWLAGANGLLGGRRPQDLLDQNIEALKGAIVDERVGITHG